MPASAQPGRPGPQPGINGPLTKLHRDLAIGTDRDGPEQPAAPSDLGALSAVVAPAPAHEQPAPARAAERPSKARSRASHPDELLKTVLAGPKTTRSFPITRLDPDLHATFRTISLKSGVSIQDLVNGAGREWLDAHHQELVDNGMLDT